MKKRSLVLIFGIISCLFVVAGVFCLIFLNLKTNPPQEIKVDESYHKISFVAPEKDAGLGYTFKISNDGVNIFIKSDVNFLEVNQDLLDRGVTLGEIYNLSYCINRGDEKEPVYSNEITWTASQFLGTTDLIVRGDSLYWSSVENADYYTISYFVLGQNYTYDTQNTNCDLSTLKGGEYSVNVQAKSHKSYYKAGKPSNMVPNLRVVHEIPAFSDVKLERFSKRLKITSSEEVSKLVVFVEEALTSYTFTNLTTTQNTDLTYTIYCDISSVYDGDKAIGVKPGEDTYNVYNGGIVWVNLTA